MLVESNSLENLRDQEQVIDQPRVESLNENSDQPRRANRPEQQQSVFAARSQGTAAEAQSNEPGTEGTEGNVSITVGRKGGRYIYLLAATIVSLCNLDYDFM